MENRDQQKNIVAKYFDQHFFFYQNINQQKSTKINILVDFCLPAGPKQHKPTKINKSHKNYTSTLIRAIPPKKTNHIYVRNQQNLT